MPPCHELTLLDAVVLPLLFRKRSLPDWIFSPRLARDAARTDDKNTLCWAEWKAPRRPEASAQPTGNGALGAAWCRARDVVAGDEGKPVAYPRKLERALHLGRSLDEHQLPARRAGGCGGLKHEVYARRVEERHRPEVEMHALAAASDALFELVANRVDRGEVDISMGRYSSALWLGMHVDPERPYRIGVGRFGRLGTVASSEAKQFHASHGRGWV
jgi:hypothetical protein